jgi:hypothetical protein
MRMLLEDTIGAVSLTRLSDDRLTEQKGAVGVWEAPVWHLGVLNLNGRVYTHELGERIVTEGRATLAYDGHDGDRAGDYGPAKAVCKNPRIEGNDLVVEIFVIDPVFEARMAAINNLGVGIGISSVGYGETDEEGVVNAATYELVRYLDFVTAPANKSVAIKKERRVEALPDDAGTPAPEATEASVENAKRLAIYMHIQEAILERRQK